MWELRTRLSRGRISLRRISLLVTATMMTFFVTTAALTATTFADSAVRSGDSVVYQGKTLRIASQEVINAAKPAGSPDGTSGYYLVDPDQNKAYFIFTAGQADQAASGFYVVYDFTPPQNYSNPSPPATIDITTDPNPVPEPASNCSGSVVWGIGWIVCPVVTFLAKGMDTLYDIISSFMVVTTVTNNTDSSVYRFWALVRDVANICFVIVFLIIVYSQITSVGISNYNIKTMLPRLIIAAILVNTSYLISAIGVDLSNILGSSVHNIFTGIMDSVNTGANYNNVTVPTWEIVTGAVLSGGTAVAGIGVAVTSWTFTGAIYLLIPMLVGAVLSALVALIVLAARQALIICLIIISPLAMVAYVLPNTEKYFEKWRSAYLTMLMLFPIFSVIFGGAQLAGLAIVQNAGGNILMIILGMAVQVAPVVVTPMLVKFGGGVIGKLAGILNNPNKGLLDRTRNWSQGMSKEQRDKTLAGKTRLSRSRFGKALYAGTRALDNRRRRIEGRRKAYESMAENRFAATRYGQDIEAMNRGAANDRQRIDNRFANSARGRQLELESRHLGVEKQEIENSLLRSDGGRRLTRRQQMAEIDKTRVSNEFESSRAGRQVDLARRIVDAQKKRIENTHQANWDTAVQTDANLKELELSVKASEVKASLAKGKLEKMHAEIAADGSASEHVMHLRGVDTATQDRILQIARDIKTDNVQQAFAANAKVMAERKITEIKTAALQDNVIRVDGGTDIVTIDGKTIVEYNAGVMNAQGERAVLAKAKSENSAAIIEDVKNIQNTMEWGLSTDNDRLRAAFESTDLVSEKVAYVKAMAKNGGPGAAAVRQLLSDIGDHYNPNHINAEDMTTFKELLASEGSVMGIGKDVEFFLTNSTARDATGATLVGPSGPVYRTFDDLSNDIDTWTNLSDDGFARMSLPAQFHALEVLHERGTHEQYMNVINSLRSSTALGLVKQKVREKHSIYSDSQLAAAAKEGRPLPTPGTIVTKKP